jgi:hypothetical protein
MKFFILILLLCSFSSFASTEAEARLLFEKYLTSFESKDLPGLLSTMDDHFIKETGGKEHWKEVIETFAKDYKGAKVKRVELRTVRGNYYGRFNFSQKNKKESPLSDKWFLLVLIDGKFVIHDFIDHFNPDEKEN